MSKPLTFCFRTRCLHCIALSAAVGPLSRPKRLEAWPGMIHAAKVPVWGPRKQLRQANVLTASHTSASKDVEQKGASEEDKQDGRYNCSSEPVVVPLHSIRRNHVKGDLSSELSSPRNMLPLLGHCRQSKKRNPRQAITTAWRRCWRFRVWGESWN